MKKRIMAALLASAMILSVAGCGAAETTTTTKAPEADAGTTTTAAPAGNDDTTTTAAPASDVTLPDTDEVLTIVAWESNSDVQNMKKIFCEQTGVSEDKIVISPQGANGEAAREQYQQYLKGEGDADILCLEADWILKYINDDELTAPLSALGLSEANYSDAYGYTTAIGINENGVLKGASFQAAPGGFLYRSDLAEQYLGVKTPDEMQALVSDWTKFQETAAKVSEASAGAASLTATEGGLWQVYQANRTQPWVVDGKLVMDTATDFYEIAKTFKDNKYMAGVPQWDPAWYAAVTDGTALGDFVSTWGLTNARDSIAFNFSGGANNLALCEGPTNYFWGGTWLGVSTKCNTSSLAKQFIEFFTVNADTMKIYSETTGDFCNNKTAMKAIVDGGANKNALLGGQDQFAVLFDAVDGISMDGLITKYDSVIKNAFNTSVNGYLDGTYATVDDAVASFKTSVKASYPELTVE